MPRVVCEGNVFADIKGTEALFELPLPSTGPHWMNVHWLISLWTKLLVIFRIPLKSLIS